MRLSFLVASRIAFGDGSLFSVLTLWCPLSIDNNLKTSCRSLMYWLCKFITAAFIWTHDIKLEMKSEQLTKKLQPCCTSWLFIILAVKTGSKRMTKAYSKISGYDRSHVFVFVSDKKISTLESVFKNFRIRPENTLNMCGRKPYS